MTTGQDYNIHFVNASNDVLMNDSASTKSNLTNKEWQSRYDTSYVPDSGDLYLVINETCLNIKLESNSSPPSWSCLAASEPPGPNEQFAAGASFTVLMLLDLEAYDGRTMPRLIWPNDTLISVSSTDTWRSLLSIDDQGWLSTTASLQNLTLPLQSQTPSNTIFHVAYGLSTHAPQSSSVQISWAFITVVILCNFVKTVAIFFTLRHSYSQQILTLGDAISTYLQHPEQSTIGACLLSKKDLLESVSQGGEHQPVKWQHRQAHFLLGLDSNGWITYLIL